jgi:hypothetical protein
MISRLAADWRTARYPKVTEMIETGGFWMREVNAESERGSHQFWRNGRRLCRLRIIIYDGFLVLDQGFR